MIRHLIVVFIAAAVAFGQNVSPQQQGGTQPGSSARTKAQAAQPSPPKTPEAILEYLIPDNIAYPGRLPDVPPGAAISALTEAQPRITGMRADAVAYLLVLLGHEPDANRTRLFDAVRNCARDPENCDERAFSYLSDLFSRGDTTVVAPMLAASQSTDPLVTDPLASTYQDMIAHDPRAFMTAVAQRTPQEQEKICHMVAVGDGGGMPDEAVKDVENALEQMARQTGPLSRASMTCLTQIRAEQ